MEDCLQREQVSNHAGSRSQALEEKEMTSLCTGCAGFLGSHVCDELLKMGHTVVGLDDLSGGFRENVPKGVEFYEGGLKETKLLHSLFSHFKFDYVFHLAAYAAEGLSHFIRRYNYENNVIGSMNLINAAVNAGTVKCFVFTSSIAVYGEMQDEWIEFSEEMTPNPMDPYGIAKYAVELDLKAANKMFGLPYIIFRPHNVYGPRQNLSDPYRNVVGIFIRQALRGEPRTIFGDGTQTRNFSYVDDVAPIIAKSINTPRAYGETINIGGGVYHSILFLESTVSEKMGVPSHVQHLPPRIEATDANPNHLKQRDIFGPLENDSLSLGISKTVKWAKSLPALREPKKFASIEVTKNLPPSWT